MSQHFLSILKAVLTAVVTAIATAIINILDGFDEPDYSGAY